MTDSAGVSATAATSATTITGPVPVLTPATFSNVAGYGLDALIGTIVATNSPTAFQITGDPSSYFIVYAATSHIRTSTNKAVPTGAYNIQIAGTNASGQGPFAAFKVVVGNLFPVVTSANFSNAARWGPNGLIGVVVATNNPTSFQISGDSNHYFQIDNSGNLRTTALSIVPDGSYNISIAATNSVGQGAFMPFMVVQGPVIINQDPWATLDGRANAPTGAPQFPTLLNGYPTTSPPNARTRWPNNGSQPPWYVSGVDYAVGPNSNYGSSPAWKIPTGVPGGNTALPSGASLNAGLNRVTIGSAGVTLDGWDFTQGNGQSLLVQANNFTMTNCKLMKTDASFSMLETFNSGTVVRYCDFNMNGFNSDSTGLVATHNCGDSPGTIIEYCYLRYAGSDFMALEGAAISLLTFQFNLVLDAGCLAGSHPDWLQIGTGSYDFKINFNVFAQHNTPVGSQPITLNTTPCVGIQGIVNANVFLALNSASAGFPGGNNLNHMFSLDDTLVIGSGFTVTNNYLDATAALGNWFGPGTYSGVTKFGNINLLNGAADNPP